MNKVFFSLTWGFGILVPFVLLETVNRWKYQEEFPFAVFGFMWVLQSIFVALLLPSLKDKSPKKSMVFWLRIAGLALVGYIWLGWVVDQWPCFVGVPNCD